MNSTPIIKSPNKLAYILLTPALIIFILVAVYPISYAFWNSLQVKTLTSSETKFVGINNYWLILTSSYWWIAVLVTLIITIIAVTFEFILGMIIALIMHRTIYLTNLIRTVVLLPYAIVTAVSAYSWFYAWTPGTGYLANLFFNDYAPLSNKYWSLVIIILSEIWKTTPFMSLLLLAGLVLIPADVIKAARMDGANYKQILSKIIIPLMKPTIIVAIIFRIIDSMRIFDNIYILTRGNNNTYSISILGYDNLFKAFNVGVGSALCILIFLLIAFLVMLFIKLFGNFTVKSND